MFYRWAERLQEIFGTISSPPVFSRSGYREGEKKKRLDFIILLIVLWLLGKRAALILVSGNNSFVQLGGW